MSEFFFPFLIALGSDGGKTTHKKRTRASGDEKMSALRKTPARISRRLADWRGWARGTGCNQHPSPFANEERFAVGWLGLIVQYPFNAKFCKSHANTQMAPKILLFFCFLINFLGRLNELKTRSEN